MKLVIASLFIVTFLARNNHVTGDMQSCSKSVHTVWMLNRCAIAFQQPAAVTTMPPEFGFNCMNVFWVGDI